jgi:hypothetical protein
VIAIATRPLKEAAGFEVLGAFREAPVRVRMRIPRRRKNGCGRVLFGLAGPVHQRVPSAVCGQVVEGAGEVAGAGDVTELTTTLDRNRSPPLLHCEAGAAVPLAELGDLLDEGPPRTQAAVAEEPPDPYTDGQDPHVLR